MSGNKKK